MKKLTMLIAAGSLALAAPVFACPGHDSDTAAPKTADKTPTKTDKGTATNDKAKEAPKAPATTAKDTAKAAPSKDAPKKPDKVSQK